MVAAILLQAHLVIAQEASDSVKRTCRQFTDSTARIIKDAQKRKIDPASRLRKTAEVWLDGVQNHMLTAAERAEYLTETELAAAGYSYCVERRPADR
jgi:hypothetical protein